MDMIAYLAEMQPAIDPIIKSVWFEELRVKTARAAVAAAQAAIDNNVRRMEWLNDNPDLDDDGLGTFLKWDTYFENLPAHDKATLELSATQQRIAALAFSRVALSGVLLQFAKQGISIVHGSRRAAPDGRIIAAPEALRDVIWEGRNHGLHWESGSPHSNVIRVFTSLETNNRGVFANYIADNKAFELISLLGWHDWSSFEKDMLSLG